VKCKNVDNCIGLRVIGRSAIIVLINLVTIAGMWGRMVVVIGVNPFAAAFLILNVNNLHTAAQKLATVNLSI